MTTKYIVLRKSSAVYRLIGWVKFPCEIGVILAAFWFNHRYVADSAILALLLASAGAFLLFTAWMGRNIEFMSEDEVRAHLAKKDAAQ